MYAIAFIKDNRVAGWFQVGSDATVKIGGAPHYFCTDLISLWRGDIIEAAKKCGMTLEVRNKIFS